MVERVTDAELLSRLTDVVEQRDQFDQFVQRNDGTGHLADTLRAIRCSGECSNQIYLLRKECAARGLDLPATK